MSERDLMAVVSDLMKSVLTVEQQIGVAELAFLKGIEFGREMEKRDRRAINAERMRDVRCVQNVQHVQHTGESAPTPPRDINNNKITPPPPLETQSGFSEWYAVYPRKEAKRGAEKAYRHALKRGATPENLLVGVKRYASECSGRERRFIKTPAVWLNNDCWLDEPPKVINFHNPPPRPWAEIKAEREAKKE